jgi:hypothetical protein
MRTLFNATIALCAVGTYMLADLATSYAVDGYGLHPALCVVGAAVFTLAACTAFALRGRL